MASSSYLWKCAQAPDKTWVLQRLAWLLCSSSSSELQVADLADDDDDDDAHRRPPTCGFCAWCRSSPLSMVHKLSKNLNILNWFNRDPALFGVQSVGAVAALEVDSSVGHKCVPRIGTKKEANLNEELSIKKQNLRKESKWKTEIYGRGYLWRKIPHSVCFRHRHAEPSEEPWPCGQGSGLVARIWRLYGGEKQKSGEKCRLAINQKVLIDCLYMTFWIC